MGSTQVVGNGFERGLAALETLGLVRPPNVLFAEFLSALAAEEVLDVATAEQLSAAYNRLRYAAVAVDDTQLSDAAVALDQVASRLIAMSAEDRRQLVQRIAGRIQVPTSEPAPERDGERPMPDRPAPERQTPPPAPRQNHTGQNHTGQNHAGDATAESSFERAEFLDEAETLGSSAPRADRRRSKLPRVSLELSALVALATFFGGYAFRDIANKTAEAGDEAPDSPYGPNHLTPKNAWKNPKLFLEGIRQRGQEEAEKKQYGKARLAFELLLGYSPHRAGLLTNLARLYLVPDESGTTNPQRARQLASEALDLTRQPVVLDTAAEAQFQCGNLHEAILLEREAITEAFGYDEDHPEESRQHRQNQLAKFRAAEQVQTAAHLPPAPK